MKGNIGTKAKVEGCSAFLIQNFGRNVLNLLKRSMTEFQFHGSEMQKEMVEFYITEPI